jgi:hypothetical protein
MNSDAVSCNVVFRAYMKYSVAKAIPIQQILEGK